MISLRSVSAVGLQGAIGERRSLSCLKRSVTLMRHITNNAIAFAIACEPHPVSCAIGTGKADGSCLVALGLDLLPDIYNITERPRAEVWTSSMQVGNLPAHFGNRNQAATVAIIA
jgi:hypothetical protein